jgi:YfiH family protein
MPPESGPGPVLDLAVEWAAPASVGALMTTRLGGLSRPPYDTFNLGDHVGDEPAAVAGHRVGLEDRIGARIAWLRQVHGYEVVQARPQAPVPEADGLWTASPGVACAVLVADCLPVLLADRYGRAVGAAHAGWRGLASGVVEATVQAVATAAGGRPDELVAWLGPCIGPRQFEVGADVVEAFGGGGRFVPAPRADGSLRWLADLPGLARDRLHALGVNAVAGGDWCTVTDAQRFYSYRRDGATGRMAAVVWLRG